MFCAIILQIGNILVTGAASEKVLGEELTEWLQKQYRKGTVESICRRDAL